MCIRDRPTVVDIDSWIKNPDCELIKVVSQGEADAYTRTLEMCIRDRVRGKQSDCTQTPQFQRCAGGSLRQVQSGTLQHDH